MNKKRKPRWFILVQSLAACLTGFAFLMLLGFAVEITEDSRNTDKLESLILRRTEVMNGYFAGEIHHSAAVEFLQEIESGDLLKEDLESLELWTHTDIDQVNSCNITEISLLDREAESISAVVWIDWNVSGITGSEVITRSYHAECEKGGKTLKLVEFF